MMKKRFEHVVFVLLRILAILEGCAAVTPNCSMTTPCDDQLGQAMPFDPPVQMRSNSSSLSVTLTVDIANLTYDWLSILRRTYNGNPCGPAIIVKPGDNLTIDLINNLSADNNEPNENINVMSHPNSTNIHTHGLHISSELPQDDVLMPIFPGTHYEHKYHISENQKPGTYWYHAHLHGCSAFQVQSGLAGMLIVEDSVDDMPPELEAVSCPNNCDKDIQILFQPLLKFVGLAGFGALQQKMNDYEGFRNDGYIVDGGQTLTEWLEHTFNYFTTNGQLQPVVVMRPGEMFRFRMVNAGAYANLETYIIDHYGNATPNCEIREIALDGVYLPAPRIMHDGQSLLVPGNSVDWLAKCNVPGMYKIASFHHKENDLSIGYVEVFNDDLVLLNCTGDPVNTTDFPTTLPGNIADEDLRNVTEEDISGRFVVQFESQKHLNGELWNKSKVYRYKMKLGEVQEWQILNTDKAETHQFHMHVNHFQVISYNKYTGGVGTNEHSAVGWYLSDVNDMNETCYYQREDYVPGQPLLENPTDKLNSTLQYLGHDERYAADEGGTLGYARSGDWKDTINVPPLINITIRFIPMDYTGNVVIHCHILHNTDEGMMMLVDVVDPDESTSDALIKSGDAYPGTCRKCDRYPPNNATNLCGD